MAALGQTKVPFGPVSKSSRQMILEKKKEGKKLASYKMNPIPVTTSFFYQSAPWCLPELEAEPRPLCYIILQHPNLSHPVTVSSFLHSCGLHRNDNPLFYNTDFSTQKLHFQTAYVGFFFSSVEVNLVFNSLKKKKKVYKTATVIHGI